MVGGTTDSLNLSTAVTSDNTDVNAPPVTFSVTFSPVGCGTYNSATKVITAGSEFGTITVVANKAAYTNSNGVPVLAATKTFTLSVKMKPLITSMTDLVQYLYIGPTNTLDFSQVVTSNNNESALQFEFVGSEYANWNPSTKVLAGVKSGGLVTLKVTQNESAHYVSPEPLFFYLTTKYIFNWIKDITKTFFSNQWHFYVFIEMPNIANVSAELWYTIGNDTTVYSHGTELCNGSVLPYKTIHGPTPAPYLPSTLTFHAQLRENGVIGDEFTYNYTIPGNPT